MKLLALRYRGSGWRAVWLGGARVARSGAGGWGARFALALLVLLPELASACGAGYVLRVGLEEGRILWRRRPIGELLADRALGEAERRKLLAVVEARRYASEVLGLRVGQSFTTVSYLTPGTSIHVLSAAPVDSLEPHSWWFPVVGRVPYKGFFDREQAQAARRKLEREGLDTYLRTAAAFSTLGWFDDPLLLSALDQDEVSLVNVVIHELCHNTFSLGNDTSFDESLANFVGTIGAMEFFSRRDGPQSELARRAARDWEEELVMADFLERWRGELLGLYRSGLPRAEVKRRREEIFARALAQARALDLAPQTHFFSQGMNNAIVIHYSLYLTGMNEFARLYQGRGSSLRETIDTLKLVLDGSDNPFETLRQVR